MKAHIRPENEVFLLYKLSEDSEKGKKLREVLSQMNIESVSITDDMLLESVGFCAKMDGFTSCGNIYDGESLPYEMMVMKIASRNRLNEVLTRLQKEGLRVERKAVITPTNRGWPFCQLYEEVCKEHELMTRDS